MSLRSPTDNEIGQLPRHDFASVVIPAHSLPRTRSGAGIQVCSRRIGLDTRPRFREGMLSNRGYDGAQPLPFPSRTFQEICREEKRIPTNFSALATQEFRVYS